MPVIKSAKKKLRRDKKVRKRNSLTKISLENAIKAARKSPTSEKVRKATILVDNKASRIKSSLSKLIKTNKKSTAKSTKKTAAAKAKK